jgi:hypothetical protein
LKGSLEYVKGRWAYEWEDKDKMLPGSRISGDVPVIWQERRRCVTLARASRLVS